MFAIIDCGDRMTKNIGMVFKLNLKLQYDKPVPSTIVKRGSINSDTCKRSSMNHQWLAILERIRNMRFPKDKTRTPHMENYQRE
ncbi:hypothetical protein MTR_5g036280 [Medicago truncatula]|uniref:Uncharacterized protein n=1 Tax=Medicago truncatula TaxID=3880 RepID=G7K5K0_MEDTR|nr:hypothetical protein MTR_5g036280 [Medicago truncatula]